VLGKANAVPDAMRKASDRARRSMQPFRSLAVRFHTRSSARLAVREFLLKPASPGTGVIAGGGVRAVLEAAGVSDILTKSLGSNNVLNVVLATMDALDQLKSPQEVAARRGKPAAGCPSVLGAKEKCLIRANQKVKLFVLRW
jgi:small subunit ribosomal protein S5